MTELHRLRDRATKNDSVIIFLSGHGAHDPTYDQTYWLTFDTKLECLDDRGVRLTHLLEYVGEIKAERKLLILDHCFSGQVIREEASESGSSKDGQSDRKKQIKLEQLNERSLLPEKVDQNIVIEKDRTDDRYIGQDRNMKGLEARDAFPRTDQGLERQAAQAQAE